MGNVKVSFGFLDDRFFGFFGIFGVDIYFFFFQMINGDLFQFIDDGFFVICDIDIYRNSVFEMDLLFVLFFFVLKDNLLLLKLILKLFLNLFFSLLIIVGSLLIEKSGKFQLKLIYLKIEFGYLLFNE